MRRSPSVYPRVAATLVGLQLATGLVAVTLSAIFAYDQALDLTAGTIRLQLDRLAEEVEQRAAPLASGLDTLPIPLERDLAARFPDPIVLLDEDGAVLRRILPRSEVFPTTDSTVLPGPLPAQRVDLMAAGDVVVRVEEGARARSWGLAPVYDADGLLVGGILVQPLAETVRREMAGTRRAYVRALGLVAVLSILSALVLGAVFTARLVRPLRRVAAQVERIGQGDYAARLPSERDDEFGTLAASVNRMAEQVEASIEGLRATDALRRELVANVGHDLRTPLTSLLGYTEEAQRLAAEGATSEAREALETAMGQGRFLQRLVDDLFELSLLDQPHPPLHREPVLLGELLSEAASRHQSAFARADVRFEADIPRTLPTIRADGVRLLRLFDNLLTNARQHTPRGGTVRLVARSGGDTTEVVVSDTGPGLAPEVLPRVFERYYRGEDARTRRGPGTGLGLAISQAIAVAHGGRLTAESTPGAGATFRLELPIPNHSEGHQDESPTR